MERVGWLPLAPTDLPACGFRNQIIGSEATEQLSLGPPGLPGFFQKWGLAEKRARLPRRYEGVGGAAGGGPGPGKPSRSLPVALWSLISSNRYLLSMYTMPGTGAPRAGTRAVPKPTSLPPQAWGLPASAASLLHSSPVEWGWEGEECGPGGLARGPAHGLMETTWRVRSTPPPAPPLPSFP